MDEKKITITVIAEDKEDIFECKSYYELLHYMFDLIIFRMRKERITIKIEWI